MKKAFTLIELMVVISVIAILSTIALFGLRGAQDAAKDTKKIASIQGLKIGLEKFYADQGFYPAAWANITAATFNNVYATIPTSGDSGLSFLGANAPRVTYYTGNANGYTLSFARKAGGTMSYGNPN